MQFCAKTNSNNGLNLCGVPCPLELTAHLLLVSLNRIPLRTFSHTYLNEEITFLVLQKHSFLFLGRRIYPQGELYSHFLSVDFENKNVWNYWLFLPGTCFPQTASHFLLCVKAELRLLSLRAEAVPYLQNHPKRRPWTCIRISLEQGLKYIY